MSILEFQLAVSLKPIEPLKQDKTKQKQKTTITTTNCLINEYAINTNRNLYKDEI